MARDDEKLLRIEPHRRTKNIDEILETHRELYTELYDKINALEPLYPLGLTDTVLKVLIIHYPPEMAELLVLLSTAPKTAEQLAKESGKPLEEVKQIMHQYWLQGESGTTKEFVEENGYVLPMGWGLSINDHPFCDGAAGSRKYISDDAERLLGDLMSKIYFEEGWIYQWGSLKDPPNMVCVDERYVEKPEEMEPWEKASEHILQAENVGITRCACRIRHGKYWGCKHAEDKHCIDTCIQMPMLMGHYPGREAGKYTTKETALENLRYGLDNGLISMLVAFDDPKLQACICQCCGDCCHVISTWTKFGLRGGFHRSNYQPKVDLSKCIFEGALHCVHACPDTSAMWYHPPTRPDRSDKFIGVNPDTCIGCGVCAAACPEHAISMVKVRNYRPTPFMLEKFEWINKPIYSDK